MLCESFQRAVQIQLSEIGRQALMRSRQRHAQGQGQGEGQGQGQQPRPHQMGHWSDLRGGGREGYSGDQFPPPPPPPPPVYSVALQSVQSVRSAWPQPHHQPHHHQQRHQQRQRSATRHSLGNVPPNNMYDVGNTVATDATRLGGGGVQPSYMEPGEPMYDEVVGHGFAAGATTM
jgi:hypothetical protein